MRFVLLLFLPIYLLGSQNFKQFSLNDKYINAVKLYKSKNYKQSYEILSKLYLTKLSDAKLNFYLGRSAYETGHYEIALGAFERVEMLNPENLRNKLEMGRTYYMLRMYEEAEVSFKSVLNNPSIPKNVRTNIEMFLAKISKAQQKSFTHATVRVDLLYDSNINYASLNDTYEIGDVTLPTSDEKSDHATQIYTEIVNIYDIGEKNSFAIKNSLSVFLKDYAKENDYDLQYVGYVPSLLYHGNAYTVELSLGLDLMTLANSDYLQSYFFIPKYEYRHTTSLKSIVYFKYQKKQFQQDTDYGLNANHYELYYALQKIINPHSYMQTAISGTKEQKTQGKRIDVDYEEYKLSMIYANQLNSRYGVELYAEAKNRSYSDASDIFNKKREDNSATVGANLNIKILPTLTFNVKASYNRLESNVDLYSYKKYVISSGMTKKF